MTSPAAPVVIAAPPKYHQPLHIPNPISFPHSLCPKPASTPFLGQKPRLTSPKMTPPTTFTPHHPRNILPLARQIRVVRIVLRHVARAAAAGGVDILL